MGILNGGKQMKSWKRSDGRPCYKLPNCKICGKRSNTSDKETARDAEKYGRICRECTMNAKKGIKKAIAEGDISAGDLVQKGLSDNTVKKVKDSSEDPLDEIFVDRKSIWQKIREWFYD